VNDPIKGTARGSARAPLSILDTALAGRGISAADAERRGFTRYWVTEHHCLRRRQIKHTIPEPKNQRANRQARGSKGGRPVGFDNGCGHEVRQACLHLPRHRHRRLDPSLAPLVIRRLATRPSPQPTAVPRGRRRGSRFWSKGHGSRRGTAHGRLGRAAAR
jgi:hypothetical protein